MGSDFGSGDGDNTGDGANPAVDRNNATGGSGLAHRDNPEDR